VAALLAELERIEAALSGFTPAEDERTALAGRLRRLSRALDTGDDADGAEAAAQTAEKIQAASVDEIFAFIDNDLELS
jgi:hypothetical protein